MAKKRIHELAKELDVTSDRLKEIALEHGMRFTSNFNAVEPEQEEKLRTAVLGPLRAKAKPIVRIVKTAKQKRKEARAAEEEAAAIQAEEEAAAEQQKVKVVKSVKKVEKKEEKEEAKPVVEAEASAIKEEVSDEPVQEPVAEKVEEKKAEPKKVEEKPAATVKKVEKPAPAKEEIVELDIAAVQAAEELAAQKTKHKKKKPVGREVDRDDERVPGKKPAGKRQVAGGFDDEMVPRPTKKKKKKKKQKKVVESPHQPQVRSTGKKREKAPVAASTDHITLSEGMTLKDFAEKIGMRAKDVIQKLFLEKGAMATINSTLDMDTANWLAEQYNVTTEEITYEEEIALKDELETEGEAIERAPVVTIMGHVDHGKTSLLDYIRKTQVAEGEHGGITQHIGAYKVFQQDKPIVFLDTPGHEAFTRLRARGAGITDVVILIVAADDGVMPQTVESIQHAKAANVPIIIAITKIDKNNANVDRVKQQLTEHEIVIEEWGGEYVCVEVSNKTGEGISDLLDMILLVTEMADLKAYPEVKGSGSVIEARLDKARGPVASILVQNGTMHIGDFFIAGLTTGKIKAMFDDSGKSVKEAGPATPVEILGFNDVPESGDSFQVVEDETKANQMVTYRRESTRERDLNPASKISLDDLFSKIDQGEMHELPLIIKGDVKGSVEALSDSLEKLSTDKVKVKIMLAQPGAITESDVLLATTSNAIIIGFNVRAQKGAEKTAEKEGVEIRTYNIIYETIKDVKDAMVGMLDPIIRERTIGKAEVREVFKVPKIGRIAGSYVIEGEIRRNAEVRQVRDDIVIWEGRPGSLRRFKDDVREVKQGYECGIGLDGQIDIREGDIIEFYVREEHAAKLE